MKALILSAKILCGLAAGLAALAIYCTMIAIPVMIGMWLIEKIF